MTTYVPHTIRVRIPRAQHVALVGDFNNWHSNAHPLVEVAPGVWERIVDLPEGSGRYVFFVVDDLKETEGAFRSRVVEAEGAIRLPEELGHRVSVTAHPSLMMRRLDFPQTSVLRAAS